jgi:hypothetical protein
MDRDLSPDPTTLGTKNALLKQGFVEVRRGKGKRIQTVYDIIVKYAPVIYTFEV